MTLVDVEVVRFLNTCHDAGTEIAHGSPYIREWMLREGDTEHKLRGKCLARVDAIILFFSPPQWHAASADALPSAQRHVAANDRRSAR